MVCFDSKICRERAVRESVEEIQRTGEDVEKTKSFMNTTLDTFCWKCWQDLEVLQFRFSRDEKFQVHGIDGAGVAEAVSRERERPGEPRGKTGPWI